MSANRNNQRGMSVKRTRQGRWIWRWDRAWQIRCPKGLERRQCGIEAQILDRGSWSPICTCILYMNSSKAMKNVKNVRSRYHANPWRKFGERFWIFRKRRKKRRDMFPGKSHVITTSSINMRWRTCTPYKTTAQELRKQEYGGRRLFERSFWLMGCDFLRKASEIRRYRFIRDILTRNLVD